MGHTRGTTGRDAQRQVETHHASATLIVSLMGSGVGHGLLAVQDPTSRKHTFYRLADALFEGPTDRALADALAFYAEEARLDKETPLS